MTEPAQSGSSFLDRRGQVVCVAGLLIQTVLFGVVLLAGLWGKFASVAVSSAAIHLAGGIPIWVILLVVFVLRKKSKLEDLETEQLRGVQKSGLATNIFDVGDESMLLQRRRLNWTFKFLLPAFTVGIAGYHLLLGGAFLLAPGGSSDAGELATRWVRTAEPFALMVFMGAVAVLCFAYSRYVIGMAREPQWRFLRAAGSYLLGNALSATVVLVAMALAQIETTESWAEPVAAYIIRITILLLGLEVLANFVLDFYRPRRPDDESRPAFDSRLLALFSEPGGIMRSVADTINYQFGFEVSSTWFYKLVQRSVFPLVTLTAFALILLSSVVIVDVDEQAYIERFGKLVEAKGDALGPGLHFKCPWPVDRVVRQHVNLIRTLVVGGDHEKHDAEKDDHEGDNLPLLWTESHELGAESLMVVANPDESAMGRPRPDKGTRARSRSVSVSLLMISMQVEYRVKNLYDYEFRYRNPEQVLESIAYQELSDFTAGISLTDLMGKGRGDFGRRMRRRLQQRCDDELQLGIEITFVALQEAHPPPESDVAATFQSVVAAELRKAAAIEKAHGDSDRILTITAGSVDRATALDAAIRDMDDTAARAAKGEHADVDAAIERVSHLMFGHKMEGIAPASGDVATELSTARADRSLAISTAESKVRSFRNDLAAFTAAPLLFKMRRYLQLLRDKLPPLRKFVVTGDASKTDLIIQYETKKRNTLDLEPSTTP